MSWASAAISLDDDQEAKPVPAAKQPGGDDLMDALGLEAETGSRGPWTGGGLAIAALLLAAWYVMSSDSSERTRYVTQPAARGNLTVLVTATGSVQPTNQVDISSELSGTVRRVLVDYNSKVEVGGLLVELDTDKLKATLDSSRAKVIASEAKIRDAEATVIEKKADLERKKALVTKNFTSVQDLDAAQAAYDRAIAGVDSARADLGVSQADLKINDTNFGKARIISPIRGVVLSRAIEPGQTVASSLQAPVLISIAEDLTKMELQVDVDEADVGKVKIGQRADFSVDAFPERKFPAVIQDLRFASEVVQGVVTYKAILGVDNSELLLRPGMTATAEITVTEVKDTLLVPNAALRYAPQATNAAGEQTSLLRRILPGPPRFRAPSARQETGPQRTIWILRDGAPQSVAVEIGASDGKQTAIGTGAVNEGDAIVVDETTAAQ
jgi:HlyD family secretion protein